MSLTTSSLKWVMLDGSSLHLNPAGTGEHQNEDKSPTLLVRFDSDLTHSRYNLEYRLERRAAEGNTCAEGKPYASEYEPHNKHFIDLKAQ
jgi:hypothetical protein